MIVAALALPAGLYIWNRKSKTDAKINDSDADTTTNAGQVVSITDAADAATDNSSNVFDDIILTNIWWKNLNDKDQLNLAISLCDKALPIWRNYCATHSVQYRTSTSGVLHTVPVNLLEDSLQQIAAYNQSIPSAKESDILKKHYRRFIDPVLAIQDGVLLLSYPAKKIFLSVCNILKCIVETDSADVVDHFLSRAINDALDCIDVTKIYSNSDMNAFLQLYKDKLIPA